MLRLQTNTVSKWKYIQPSLKNFSARAGSSSDSQTTPSKDQPSMPNFQKIKRFYKKVDVIEHPLTESEVKIAQDEKVTLNNLSLSKDKYWAVTLNGRVTKTLFKDPLCLPSKALAVAIAEEWDSQQDIVYLKSLHLYQMVSKGIRLNHDTELIAYMKKQITNHLQNDQICFREDPSNLNEYKAKLAECQRKHTEPIFKFLEQRFGIKLKIWYQMPMEDQDKSIAKIVPILNDLDHLTLNSIFQVTVQAKSTGIALALLMDPEMRIEDASKAALVDENFQQSMFGVVEGAHDFDRAHTLTTFATAKSLLNLAQLREF